MSFVEPHCQSLYNIVHDRLGIGERTRLLDVGCGPRALAPSPGDLERIVDALGRFGAVTTSVVFAANRRNRLGVR